MMLARTVTALLLPPSQNISKGGAPICTAPPANPASAPTRSRKIRAPDRLGRRSRWRPESAGRRRHPGTTKPYADRPWESGSGWPCLISSLGALGRTVLAQSPLWGYQRAMVGHPIRILGIDPGLRRTGWGLVEADGNRLIYVACGSLETSERAALGARLVVIHDGLCRVIEQYRPHEAAVENTFVNANAVATLKLGQARGIAMLVPARAGLT